MQAGEENQEKVKIISQGDLIPEDHDVSGKALIIESNEKRYLRFENLVLSKVQI